MRSAVFFLVFIGHNSFCLADQIVAGKSGAIICKDASELFAASEAALKGNTISNDCEFLPAGTEINSIFVKAEGALRVGLGDAKKPDGKTRSGAFLVTVEDASTKPPAPASADRVFKVVSPIDVLATPSKWIGRDIEFRNVRTYWVADDDVRFITGTDLTLFGRSVRGPEAGIKFLRENCETQQEMFMAKCRVNVRFSYQKHGEDTPNGFRKRTVLISDDIEIARPVATGRR